MGTALSLDKIEGIETFNITKFVDERGNLQVFFDPSFTAVKGKDEINFLRLLKVESVKGAIRGIHRSKKGVYEFKLLYALDGTVQEVLVDLRPESKTFGFHCKIILDSTDKYGLLIPPGIGQAYEVISESATLLYAINTSYSPEKELVINTHDPDLDLRWNKDCIRSKRDQDGISFYDAFKFGWI